MSTVSDHESQSASNSSADTTSGSGAIGSTGYGSPRSMSSSSSSISTSSVSPPSLQNKNGVSCTVVNQCDDSLDQANTTSAANKVGANVNGAATSGVSSSVNSSGSANPGGGRLNEMNITKSSSVSSSSSSKTTQQHVHIASSCSEVEMTYMKSNLSELKSSISEMKNVCNNNQSSSYGSMQPPPSRVILPNFGVIRTDETSNEPVITYPESPPPPNFNTNKTPQFSRILPNNNNIPTMMNAINSNSCLNTPPMNMRNKSSSSTASNSSSSWKMSKMSSLSNESGKVLLDKMKRNQSVDESSERFTHHQQHKAARDYRKQSSTTSSSFHSEMHAAKNNEAPFAAIKMKTQPAITYPESVDDFLSQNFNNSSWPADNNSLEEVKTKYSSYLNNVMSYLKECSSNGNNLDVDLVPRLLNKIRDMLSSAWMYGHELGNCLCDSLRNGGGIDFVISQCISDNDNVKFYCAKLLEQCLTADNRVYVVKNGLEKVVQVACFCTKNAASIEHSRVSTGILERLFKHSDSTCSDVVRLGGLDAVIFECRKSDVETLRHCARALANLSLYGGVDNQEAMITRNAPMWLFPLAFHNDDSIKYYAILAIAVLVANKEIEAAVLKSEALSLVETFVIKHNPSEFAKCNLSRANGQSKDWLQNLVPVLNSKREEARNLVSFHFCMEAGIKKAQNNTEIFYDIGAVEPLKKVASSPNAIASKYAAQALRLIGEEIPHKLSQQVPLWSVEDVREWIKQISFTEYAPNFVESRVDGDLLLQLTEENLRDDIGINNGIRRRRFIRELQNLKKMADYSSRDVDHLNQLLQNIGPDFSIYTYSMVNAGVDKDFIKCLSQEQLVDECGIKNSIHRIRILNTIKAATETTHSIQNVRKTLDVFISYRRSTGSQLASLLKVHLQVRSNLSVFIDIERLEAGKFDNNLLQSIHQAKNFVLVLTPNALDRCIGDTECKDWVHKEIVAALQSKCNIIPVTDNFEWPEPEKLPEDMRAICHFNCIRWIHDYQDACVEKVERFLKEQLNSNSDNSHRVKLM